MVAPPGCTTGLPAFDLRAANPDHEVKEDLQGVRNAMENWVSSSMAPEGHSKRHLVHMISEGTTLPAVLADFWHAVGSCVDKQRLAPEDRSFRRLHILTAPFCEPLRSYKTMAILDRLLERAAAEGGCQHFMPATDHDGVTVYHNHPRFRNTPPPTVKAYAVRHSPYPSFSLAAHYKAGGGAQARWPLPPAGQEPPLDSMMQQPLRRLAPRPMQPDRSATAGSNSAGGGGGGSGGTPQRSKPEGRRGKKQAPRPDKEWAPRVRVALESAYAKAAVSASDDKVEPRGAAPATSVAVLQATMEWVARVLQEAEDVKETSGYEGTSVSRQLRGAHAHQSALRPDDDACSPPPAHPVRSLARCLQNRGLVSSTVVRRMRSVAAYSVTRSATAEDLFADVWDAVVELTQRAAEAGCAVPQEHEATLDDAGRPPCYSAVVVAPEFDAYCSEGFRRFGEILRSTLDYLPMEDNITIEVFHPEFVTGHDKERDRSAMRRSPWPAIHICFEGARVPDVQESAQRHFTLEVVDELSKIPSAARSCLDSVAAVASPTRLAGDRDAFLHITYQSTDTFYKDEGGRQAHIQEILTTVPVLSQHLETDNNGEVTVRFRIEEVSKNHRSQRFVVMITADTARMRDLPQIEPIKTAPIMVLSKRKDRKRRAEQAGLTWAPTPQAPPAAAAMTAAMQAQQRQAPPVAAAMTAAMQAQQAAGDSGGALDVAALAARRGSLGAAGFALLPQAHLLPNAAAAAAAPAAPPAALMSAAPALALKREASAQHPEGPYTAADLGPLGARAYQMLSDAEQWHMVGVGVNPETGTPDANNPIVKCHVCEAVCIGLVHMHREGCRLRRLLDDCMSVLEAAVPEGGNTGAAVAAAAAAAAAAGAGGGPQSAERRGGSSGGAGVVQQALPVPTLPGSHPAWMNDARGGSGGGGSAAAAAAAQQQQQQQRQHGEFSPASGIHAILHAAAD
ncbi:hypothetical protein JKP88DRAFT_353126 [Tribonema minus]|uniref:Uncharacterized protein n=1 Tax=Tribonema minus TaxID=303371 RepID=A0A836CL24_9STRA|nr:hypothetical protein JKP88DRAFT_353126 [Tribonema minus]